MSFLLFRSFLIRCSKRKSIVIQIDDSVLYWFSDSLVLVTMVSCAYALHFVWHYEQGKVICFSICSPLNTHTFITDNWGRCRRSSVGCWYSSFFFFFFVVEIETLRKFLLLQDISDSYRQILYPDINSTLQGLHWKKPFC